MISCERKYCGTMWHRSPLVSDEDIWLLWIGMLWATLPSSPCSLISGVRNLSPGERKYCGTLWYRSPLVSDGDIWFLWVACCGPHCLHVLVLWFLLNASTVVPVTPGMGRGLLVSLGWHAVGHTAFIDYGAINRFRRGEGPPVLLYVGTFTWRCLFGSVLVLLLVRAAVPGSMWRLLDFL